MRLNESFYWLGGLVRNINVFEVKNSRNQQKHVPPDIEDSAMNSMILWSGTTI